MLVDKTANPKAGGDAPLKERNCLMSEYLIGHKRAVRMEERFLANRKAMAHEKIAHLARELPRGFPMRRMYLFGSLADGNFRSFSDIDIALEGLEDKDHYRAFLAAEEIARPFRLDLVLLEETPPSLQRKVRERGVVIYEQRKD